MTPERRDPAVPTATYRLQLQPGFPFAAAAEAVPYLASLGVSHLHLSPVLEAVPGSQHGYDVVDHARVREELGGEEGLRELSRTARRHGLGLVVDIVPNHMAMSPATTRRCGTCCATARPRAAPAGSTSTGRPRAGRCCCRCSAARSARRRTG